MRRAVGLVCCAVMGGCAWLQPAPQKADDNWAHWMCDSQAGVQWRYASAQKDVVEARLDGSEQLYTLQAEPGAAQGTLFSDGVLAFDNQGSEGLVYWVATNDLIWRGCKAR